MKITDILPREAIIEDLKASNKRGVIEEMSELIVRSSGFSNKEELARVLLEREALCSTAIGLNIAIPHAKVLGVNGYIVALGRSKKGVDFGAVDGKLVNLFFVLISGLDSTGAHLKALSRISCMLKSEETRDALISCESSTEMYEIISQRDSKYE
jgi:PTS system nitrogen regulatory IIA component